MKNAIRAVLLVLVATVASGAGVTAIGPDVIIPQGGKFDVGQGTNDHFSSDGGTIYTPGQLAAQSLVVDGGIVAAGDITGQNLSGTNTGDNTAFQKGYAWGSACLGVCGEDTSFSGPFNPEYASFTRRVNCSAGTAGVTGGTDSLVIQLWNVTDAVEVATSTSACAAAAGVPFSATTWSANPTLSTSKTYSLRLKGTTDCGTNPSNIVCNVVFSQ